MTSKALQLAGDLVSKDITANIIYQASAELRRLDKLNKELIEITKSFIQLHDKVDPEGLFLCLNQLKARSIIAKQLGE